MCEKHKAYFKRKLTEWKSEIIKSNKVKITSLGTFSVLHKKERIGRNPKTKKEAFISERNVVLFKPSKFLKNKINNVF